MATATNSRTQQTHQRSFGNDELAESGLPLTLEHGDLWSSNVYVSDSEVAFIDGTDASLSHPFFSLMPCSEVHNGTWTRPVCKPLSRA